MEKRLQKLQLSKETLVKCPEDAGVYIFWESNKKPIYIGKSTNLKKRIQSYFSSNLAPKTSQMISEAKHISTIRVTSELEALLLEAKLVNKFKTKYNSQLKDDKHPLYIKVTNEKYPQILTGRKIDAGKDNLAYFGPFPAATNVRSVLRLLRRIFPYAQHKPGIRGCLYSQIGLCNPCPSEVEKITNDKLKNRLYRRYRKNINFIKNVLSGKIKSVKYNLQKEMGKLALGEHFEEASIVREQIKNLDYITQPIIPVNEYLKDPNLIYDVRDRELSDLKKLLSKYTNLAKLKRIECYDVAHLAGTNPTASMVTFINGEADKAFYRHFKIYQKNTSDDLSSLNEVIKRRLKHLDDWGRPNLIIVDGGKAQVKIFFQHVNKYKIPVVGLAKRFETLVIPLQVGKKLTFKEIVVPRGYALNLLQRIRNEAHRFARRLHHKLIRKELIPTQ